MKWWLRRRLQWLLFPDWFEGWRIRRMRRRLSGPRPAQPASGPRRLYVDLAIISRDDAGTGIQRVVRGVAAHLVGQGAHTWEVIPVSATRKRAYAPIAWPASAGASVAHEVMQARPGDAYLGLDFALVTVKSHRTQLADFKRSGGRLWFLMYDLLPAQQPQWFSDTMVVRYLEWLRTIAGLADGFYCISAPVQDQLLQTLRDRFGVTDAATRVLPMGSDWSVPSPQPRTAAQADPQIPQMLSAIAGRPTALMVGTLEPRKGHADVLRAFDVLWREGSGCNLVIVGRPGWKTEDLQKALRRHGRAGTHLFWLSDASDEQLLALYASCTGMIAASHGEGFGLPVVEALRHGKPVLARDLPVFRVHAGPGVSFFPIDATSESLAAAVKQWLEREPVAVAPPRLNTWADTANEILRGLDEQARSAAS